MLSWLVLIDRGFNPSYLLERDKTHYHVFRELFLYILVSNDSRVGTPVPIPNTEVKHSNADDSVCENRKLLTIFFVYKRLFLNDESFLLTDFFWYINVRI